MVVWLYFIFALIGLFTLYTAYILYPLIVCTILLAKFYLYDRKKAIKYRQVQLLPINPVWAKLLVKKYDLAGDWNRAYEIHIVFDKRPLKEQRNNIIYDIREISQQPGLYIWETHVGIPMPVKKIIKKFEIKGSGFIKEGVFLPRPPFVYIQRKSKKLCYGAVIIEKED